jgi:WD40 repeat protein
MLIRQTACHALLFVAVVLPDPRARAADPPMNPQLRTIVADGHVEGIFCVAFSPDGTRLASGGDEGEIVLWDTAAWKPLRRLAADPNGRTGHREDVWGVAFSPDGRRLASAGHDETVRIWDVETGRQIRVLRGHSFHVWGVAFSPDGKWVASAGGTSDANGEFAAGDVKLWDAATGAALLTMLVPGSRVYSVAFSPDGKTLASGWEDHTVKVWSTAGGQELFTLRGHIGEVNVVAWNKAGNLLASGSDDRTVRLWDVATRREVRAFPGCHGVAFSADGQRLATGGAEGVSLRDPATGNELHGLKAAISFSKLALSPSGKHVVWDSGNQALQVWTPE